VILKLGLSLATVATMGLGMLFSKPSSMQLVQGDTELENLYGGACFAKVGTMCGEGGSPEGCEETECSVLVGNCLRKPLVFTVCGIGYCGFVYTDQKCAFGG